MKTWERKIYSGGGGGNEALKGKRAKEGPIAARLGRYLLEEEPIKRLRSDQRDRRRSRVAGDMETRGDGKDTFSLLRSTQCPEPVRPGGNAPQVTRKVSEPELEDLGVSFWFFHFCTVLPKPKFSFHKTGNYEISLLYIII